MPPAKTNIDGNSTIWNKKGEIEDGYDSFFIASQMYPYDFSDSMSSWGNSPHDFSLEGPPNILETITSSGMFVSFKLEPPPEFGDTMTSSGELGWVRFTSPYKYDTDRMQTTGILAQVHLGEDEADPDVEVVRYTRWPLETIESTGILDTSEIILYVP